jgi:hypothetical protein
MMPTLTELNQCGARAYRTREEAARLLEELRAAYWDFSSPERSQIKNHIVKIANVQSATEKDWK